MYRGETFSHTFYMQKYAKDHFGILPFFCNDVACKFGKFAKRVTEHFPSLKYLTEKTEQFLSRMHSETHDIYCQVCI